MTFLLSVLLSSIILASCMILVLDICIKKQWNIKKWFLKLLLIVIVLKICLPIENIFSILLPVEILMNPILTILEIKLFNKILLYQIIIGFILIGSGIQVIRYICWSKEYKYILDCLKENAVRVFHPQYEIYKTSYIDTPVTIGLKGIIFIPECIESNEEMAFVVKHEIAHIKHKDNFIKFSLNILLILYWWFIPIYIFQKQLDLFLEMRADDDVINGISENEVYDYMNILIKMQRKRIESNINISFCSCLSFQRQSNLNYRIQNLLERDSKQDKKIIFLFSLILFLSCLIITPYYVESSITKGTYEISKDNAYILVNDDTKQLFVNSNGENILENINDFSSLKDSMNLVEDTKIHIPKYGATNNRNMVRWKYRYKNGNLEKREFNAYKNKWLGDWIQIE